MDQHLNASLFNAIRFIGALSLERLDHVRPWPIEKLKDEALSVFDLCWERGRGLHGFGERLERFMGMSAEDIEWHAEVLDHERPKPEEGDHALLEWMAAVGAEGLEVDADDAFNEEAKSELDEARGVISLIESEPVAFIEALEQYIEGGSGSHSDKLSIADEVAIRFGYQIDDLRSEEEWIDLRRQALARQAHLEAKALAEVAAHGEARARMRM